MERFTTKTPMGVLFQSEECKDFADFFMYTRPPVRRLSEEMTLEDLKRKDPNRNVDTMCDGVNHLVDTIRSGVHVVWDYWDEAARREDPEKEGTKLFYLPGARDQKKPFVMICAGGGYTSVCSMVEGFPMAQRVNELGYDAFVMSYRVGREGLFPDPMEDLAQALRFVIEHAEEFGVETEGYAVAGFSAAGHLVAEWGTQNMGYEAYGLPKPGAIFPVYPIIDLSEIAKRGDRFIRNLGGDDVEAAIEKYSVSRHVGDGYPPTFGMHCKDDPAVPYEQSLILQEKLEERGIPHRLRSGETGGHGIGVGVGSDVEGWVDEAIAFWEEKRNG